MQIQFKDYKTAKDIFAYNANFVPVVGDFVEYDSRLYLVKERVIIYLTNNIGGENNCLYHVFISYVENNTQANLYF